MTDLPIQDWLEGIRGLIVEEPADPTGNPITRLKDSIAPAVSGLDIGEFAKGLRNGDPSIVVRDHYGAFSRQSTLGPIQQQAGHDVR
mgnify:FL=1